MTQAAGTLPLLKDPDGPRGNIVFGSIADAWNNPLTLMMDTVREHGEVSKLRFGYMRYIVVADPAGIHHVLVTNNKNYVKSRNYNGIKALLGEGLLTSEGDFWRKQRKLAQPAFHRERLASFVQSMSACTGDMLDRWTSEAKGKRLTLDAHREMMRLTFRIVGQTLLSTELDGEAKAIGDALTIAIHWANDYVEQLVRLPPWIPVPKNVRFNRSKKIIDEMILRVIADRRSGEPKNDLLTMLMETKDETTGEQMSDEQLKNELLTLVLAGHETTANALAFTLYLLSRHPDVRLKLEAEVKAVLDGRTPVLADMPKLAYTMQVIEESMRLYPPAWCYERTALEDDAILGYRVPKGSIVGLCPFATHRLARLWPNPEGFDPSRFSREHGDTRPRFAYLPFGGGPRQCIGNQFALMEMQIILAMLAQRARLDLEPGFVLALDPSITLRPKAGIPMSARLS